MTEPGLEHLGSDKTSHTRRAASAANRAPIARRNCGRLALHLKNAASGFGPTAAVEVTPIEHWLELEAGVTSLFGRHSTEWSADLLFKKPWSLSKEIEFMIGAGAEWIHTRESGTFTNSVGAEAVLDFIFWHSRKHRFGWYLEPTYEYKIRAEPRTFSRRQWRNLIAIP